MEKKKIINSSFASLLKSAVIILSVVFLIVSGCGRQNEDNDSNIHGKWKLIEIFVPFSIEWYYDYSQDDLVYDFNTNGILTISGETDPIERFRGFESGEYSYSIVDEREAEEKGGIDGGRLKIVSKYGSHYFPYNVNFEEFIFGSSMLDGPFYKLFKVKNQ